MFDGWENILKLCQDKNDPCFLKRTHGTVSPCLLWANLLKKSTTPYVQGLHDGKLKKLVSKLRLKCHQNLEAGVLKVNAVTNIIIHFHSREKQKADLKIIELMKSHYTDENIKKRSGLFLSLLMEITLIFSSNKGGKFYLFITKMKIQATVYLIT